LEIDDVKFDSCLLPDARILRAGASYLVELRAEVAQEKSMKVYENITPELTSWIAKQHVFFVGSAPLSADGHVNLSPKGNDCMRVLDDKTVCYLDTTGSGNETSAHISENGRLTFMWCAFEGAPRILRLYGRGEVVLPENTKRWNELVAQFDPLPGMRQMIVNHVDRVITSCGFAVPLMDYKEDRNSLQMWSKVKGEERLVEYRREHNCESIDGIETPLGALLRKDETSISSGSVNNCLTKNRTDDASLDMSK
jgi:hypothetical protein